MLHLKNLCLGKTTFERFHHNPQAETLPENTNEAVRLSNSLFRGSTQYHKENVMMSIEQEALLKLKVHSLKLEDSQQRAADTLSPEK